jgi:spore coat polysaccharide biosynthesis protein SpsF
MKTVAILQARMNSSRLPGKILKDVAGEPMLVRVVSRLRRAETLSEILVATTTEPADDAVQQICAARGWTCFRGSESDVLDRYYQAARLHGADVVVRVTADCPLIEPAEVERVVQEYLRRPEAVDYVCNFLPRRTYPRGLDTEVFSFEVLQRSWREDQNPAWREHVTEYLLRHPEAFRLRGVQNGEDLSALRWTVDTPEDLEFVRRIYNHFGHDRFFWREVLDLLARNPQWLEINRSVRQKEIV